MSVGGMYFLIFACGSFGALAIALAVATIRYQQWRRQAISAGNRRGSSIDQRAR